VVAARTPKPRGGAGKEYLPENEEYKAHTW
jgi:hypothetical protein